MKGAANSVSFPWNVSVFPFGSDSEKKKHHQTLFARQPSLEAVKVVCDEDRRTKIVPSSFPKEAKLCPQRHFFRDTEH